MSAYPPIPPNCERFIIHEGVQQFVVASGLWYDGPQPSAEPIDLILEGAKTEQERGDIGYPYTLILQDMCAHGELGWTMEAERLAKVEPYTTLPWSGGTAVGVQVLYQAAKGNAKLWRERRPKS